jgi:hypothetical protein
VLRIPYESEYNKNVGDLVYGKLCRLLDKIASACRNFINNSKKNKGLGKKKEIKMSPRRLIQ